MNHKRTIHHYILTRFNLALWTKDKAGKEIGDTGWLERRMRLFETFCLPSVASQTSKDFEWILLLDENTPEVYLDRIKGYKERCRQIRPIKVRSGYGAHFAKIFQSVVTDSLSRCGAEEGDLCLTTYLDNDDSIARDFVEDVQRRCASLPVTEENGVFLSYDYGLQLYADMGNVTTRILYPNNHFITYAESIRNGRHVRTCYGYGSHFLIEMNGMARVEHVVEKKKPMWIEVIHKENVDNDVKMTIHTCLVKDRETLRRDFALDMAVGEGHRLRLAVRIILQAWRRLKEKRKR